MTRTRNLGYRYFGQYVTNGWLSTGVLPVVDALVASQERLGVQGGLVEIGVHHGKLFIGLRLALSEVGPAVAIDLFDDQAHNVDSSGSGNLARFRRNLHRYLTSPELVEVVSADSTTVQPEQLAQSLNYEGARLFSIDGGHEADIVAKDMRLASSVAATGCVVIADDLFNECWPGVYEGSLRFISEQDALIPFAIAFNKTLFCHESLVEKFQGSLQALADQRPWYSKRTTMAGYSVLVIWRPSFVKLLRRLARLVVSRLVPSSIR